MFLVLLDLGHGPVLSLQALLLPFSHLLGIVDQHTAPLVQFLHDLQDGHLNIHLHTLLYIRHLADRAANLLGVLLQRCMLVPEALHQRGQELALVPHCIFQELILVVLMGVELAVPAGEGVTALAEQHEGLMLVHVAVHCTLTIS